MKKPSSKETKAEKIIGGVLWFVEWAIIWALILSAVYNKYC